jgi:hypothetical protein
MTITITAYDNGMVNVNNLPLSQDVPTNWLRVNRVVACMLEEFARQRHARSEAA